MEVNGQFLNMTVLPSLKEGQVALRDSLNPLHAELNPICHLLALLGVHHIFHVSRIRIND
jgi:hypothetical protein